MGLWYLKDNDMSLTAYADADHVGCQDSRRSTSGSAQFLRDRLVSWSSKKQRSTAISTNGRRNTLQLYGCLLNSFGWSSQLKDYGFLCNKILSVTESNDTTSTLQPPRLHYKLQFIERLVEKNKRSEETSEISIASLVEGSEILATI
ncbi:hypothetical protein Tco_1121970 [Tanacetum coccineum]|uniref:Uncharacterized protein n=1 Tax=Tanacetum coccineum TaxID=301880 RepID=A0ABQ5J0S2_9ASTR